MLLTKILGLVSLLLIHGCLVTYKCTQNLPTTTVNLSGDSMVGSPLKLIVCEHTVLQGLESCVKSRLADF